MILLILRLLITVPLGRSVNCNSSLDMNGLIGHTVHMRRIVTRGFLTRLRRHVIRVPKTPRRKIYNLRPAEKRHLVKAAS